MTELFLKHGGSKLYTAAELALTVAQLTAADQTLCSSGDVAHVAVGRGLLLVDVSSAPNRRLVETFALSALSSNPFGLECTQGATGFTLQEALLMCGGGTFSSLAQVFMALFEGGEVQILKPSQLVKAVGVSNVEAAEIKEIRGEEGGIGVQVGEDAITLVLDTSATDALISDLRTDVDLNTLNLSNIDLTPYQLALSGGTGPLPFFPILADNTIRALQGDGDISLTASGGLLVLSASALREDVGANSDEVAAQGVYLDTVAGRVTANEQGLAMKQDVIGLGNPEQVHHKLLQGGSLLSLVAGENIVLEQVGDTHLQLSAAVAQGAQGAQGADLKTIIYIYYTFIFFNSNEKYSLCSRCSL